MFNVCALVNAMPVSGLERQAVSFLDDTGGHAELRLGGLDWQA